MLWQPNKCIGESQVTIWCDEHQGSNYIFGISRVCVQQIQARVLLEPIDDLVQHFNQKFKHGTTKISLPNTYSLPCLYTAAKGRLPFHCKMRVARWCLLEVKPILNWSYSRGWNSTVQFAFHFVSLTWLSGSWQSRSKKCYLLYLLRNVISYNPPFYIVHTCNTRIASQYWATKKKFRFFLSSDEYYTYSIQFLDKGGFNEMQDTVSPLNE